MLGAADLLLDRARGMTCRQIERLVAELAPRPDVPSSIRKLPGGAAAASAVGDQVEAVASAEPRDRAGNPTEQSRWTPGSTIIEPNQDHAGDRPDHQSASAAGAVARSTVDVCSGTEVGSGAGGIAGSGGARQARGGRVEVLAPERYLVKVTIGQHARAKLDRARDLMRHRVPDGELATVLELALDALIDKAAKRKFGKTTRPRETAASPRKAAASPPEARAVREHVPAAVRRAVSRRDEERCSYEAADGRRCGATAWLEFHHLIAAEKEGPTTVENCALFCALCRIRHNEHYADPRIMPTWAANALISLSDEWPYAA